MFVLTSSTKKLAKMTKRIRGVCGGTSAGKDYIYQLQILISKAQKIRNYFLTSVVSQDVSAS